MGYTKCKSCCGMFPQYIMADKKGDSCRICSMRTQIESNFMEMHINSEKKLMGYIRTLESKIEFLEKKHSDCIFTTDNCVNNIKVSSKCTGNGTDKIKNGKSKPIIKALDNNDSSSGNNKPLLALPQSRLREEHNNGDYKQGRKVNLFMTPKRYCIKGNANGNTEHKPIKLENRFETLKGLKSHDNFNVTIISDQIGCSLTTEFCGRNPVKRNHHCYKNLRVQDLSEIIHDKKRDKLIITACHQDLLENKVRRTMLIDKYRSLIKNLKDKKSDTMICGLLPIDLKNDIFLNRAFNFNRELKWLCAETQTKFVNYWDEFYDHTYVNGNAITLPGEARLGRLIQRDFESFFCVGTGDLKVTTNQKQQELIT